MMKKLVAWFRNLIGITPHNLEVESTLTMLAMTHEQELSCDEVHDLIDQFAEMHLRGENPAHLFPLVQRHLEMCPECREEFEALLAALEAS